MLCSSINQRIVTDLLYTFSCANAKKWEIELTTLKSNNNRLTSALQESTANVDEWKRQLHTYKEENLRLKREMEAMKPSTGGNTAAEFNEELRIENIKLRSRIITLEKELQEQNLKASKSNAKDKSNEQYVRINRSFHQCLAHFKQTMPIDSNDICLFCSLNG